MITLIVLAGLAAIPGEPYESAHVDGASERADPLAHHAPHGPADRSSPP